MTSDVNRAFVFLFLLVLTALCCCLGVATMNKNCELRGGHFEGYWDGGVATCVGGENR